MAALTVWVAMALVAWWSRGERQRLEAEEAIRQVMDS